MQMCTGGELFDRIVKLEKFSEKDAAELMTKILSAVQHCMNIRSAIEI